MPQTINGTKWCSWQVYSVILLLLGRVGGSKIVPSGMEQYMLSGVLCTYHCMTIGFS